MVVTIVILSPFLLLFTSAERFYPQYYVCARIWAKCVVFGMGFYPITKTCQELEKGKSYMLVANHTSMLDIMLMLSVIKHPFIFVGKKELARIPIFGFFYQKTCILVDRSCQKSRQGVVSEAQRRLNQGNSICIFPEGGVPDDQNVVLDDFKDGAFRLAIDHQIPVVPISLYDTKKRFSYSFFTGGPGQLRVKIHNFIPTTGLEQADRRRLKETTRKVLLKELTTDQNL